jgi:ABC-type multidrug transport system fused ATPase/permease subunit
VRRSADLNRLRWLLRTYLAPHWRAIGLLLVTTGLATVLAALFPLLMAPILDLALGNPATGANAGAPIPTAQLSLRNLGAAVLQWIGVESVHDRFRAIVILCFAYVAVGVVKGALDFGNYLLALWIRVRAAAAMQTDLFRHVLGLSMSFFTRQRTGDLVSRFDRDTQVATAGLETLVGTFLTAPLLIAAYGYLLARTSPRLVIAAGAAVLLHYGVTRFVRAPVRRLVAGQLSAFGDLVALIQESILSIRVVKSFSAEASEVTRLAQTLGQVVRFNVKFGVYKHAEEPARAAVNHVVEGGILLLAAWELLSGRLAAPTFFLFLYIGRAVMVQLGLLGSAYSQLQTALAAAGRVTELFDETPRVKDGPEPIAEFRDRIVLRDVTFDYGAERVLSGVNLEIRKGEVVALVGRSGAGKSTLADLILRLYDPVAGSATIDGRDLRVFRQREYRRLFGVVSQEALLFNASIRDNIAYGRDGLSEDAVMAAARVANAHDFIVQLPDGYATMVGDRGVRLSGGQRQRVAIARAIVGNPPILVLDEATSSLDSESERLVQQAIERVIHGATSVVIAHRLSTVLHADKIVVLNGGTVEAVGRHAELLGANETYSKLYRLQFAEEASVTT